MEQGNSDELLIFITLNYSYDKKEIIKFQNNFFDANLTKNRVINCL